MKAEISHPGYRPARHFTGVYHQLGRMLLDRDFNELCDILREQATTVAAEAIGTGVPDHDGLVVAEDDDPETLRLSAVGGVVTSDGVIGRALRDPQGEGDLYRNQADLPDRVRPAEPDESDPELTVPLIAAAPDGLLLYVDIWDRAVTAFETDPSLAGDLIDPALHGADTSFRSQRQVQIKAATEEDRDPDSDPCRPAFLADRIPSCGTALFSAELIEATEERDPCDPCAEQIDIANLVENHLFRLEVHDVVYGEDRRADRIWLKWSNDNGAREFTAGDFSSHADPNRHSYEYFSDATERLLGMPSDDWPGTPQLRGVLDPESRATDPIETDLIIPVLPRVREWDGWCALQRDGDTWELVEGRSAGTGLADAAVSIDGGEVTVDLEDKRFTLDLAGRTVLAGDYWLAVARTRAAPNRQLSVVSAEPLGVKHHYCILGTATAIDAMTIGLDDLNAHDLRRLQYPTLTCLEASDVGYATDCPSGLFDNNHDTVKKALDQVCRIGAEHVGFSTPCNTSIYSQPSAPQIATVADALRLLCHVSAEQIGFEPQCDFLREVNARTVAEALEALCGREASRQDLPKVRATSWRNDESMRLEEFLSEGLGVAFDRPVLTDLISTDSFIVTLEVPLDLPSNAADMIASDFYTMQIVAGRVEPRDERVVVFRPRIQASISELERLIGSAVKFEPDFPGLRCRVRLVGQSIFGEERRDHLDGFVPTVLADEGMKALDFDNAGLGQVSDFESWFYLVGDVDRRLDLNFASREELVELPGITPAIADEIIAGQPSWRRFEDLRSINGIGRSRINMLRERVVIR